MKKQLLMLLLFSLLKIQARELDLAIEASDLEAVQLLIAKQPLKEKEMIKYLDYADKMIALRREQMICAQMGKFGYCPELVKAKLLMESVCSLSLTTGLFGSLTFFMEKQTKASLILMGISLITAVPGVYLFEKTKRLFKEKFESFERNHSSALKIKELLFEISD